MVGKPSTAPAVANLRGLPLIPIAWPKAAAMLGAAVLASAAAAWLHPQPVSHVPTVSLKESVPSEFATWREVKSTLVPMSLIPEGDRSEAVAQVYDESIMTTYADSAGHQVMVAFAYGQNQRQEGKIHRPELCYSSQGFSVSDLGSEPLPLSLRRSGAVKVNRIIAQSRGRKELVSYWIRIGDLFSTNAVETRLYLLKEGLEGNVPDGILFRVSQIVHPDATEQDMDRAFRLQERLMLEMTGAFSNQSRHLLVGTT